MPSKTGLLFAGSGNRVPIPSALRNQTTSERTNEYWVQTGADVTTLQIVHEQGFELNGYNLQIDAGRIYGCVYSNSGAKNFPSAPVTADTVYRISVVHSDLADDVKLYIDGVLAEISSPTTQVNPHGGGALGGNDGNLTYIHGGTTSSALLPFAGFIGHFRAWNVARTQSAIQADMDASLAGSEASLLLCWNMDEGSGTTLADVSPNALNGTISGATWSSVTYGSTTPLAVDAGAVSAVASVPAAEVMAEGEIAVSAGPVSGVASAPAASVSAEGEALLELGTVSVRGEVPGASVSAEGEIPLDLGSITAIASVPAHAATQIVGDERQILLSPITLTASVPATEVMAQGQATLGLGSVSGMASVPAPTVTPEEITVSAGSISAIAKVPAVSVSTEGAVEIRAGPVSVSASVPSHSSAAEGAAELLLGPVSGVAAVPRTLTIVVSPWTQTPRLQATVEVVEEFRVTLAGHITATVTEETAPVAVVVAEGVLSATVDESSVQASVVEVLVRAELTEQPGPQAEVY